MLDEIASQIPTFFMRYEDLKVNPKPVLEGMCRFLLNVDSIEGTVVEKRINEVTQIDSTKIGTYQLKTNSQNLSR